MWMIWLVWPSPLLPLSYLALTAKQPLPQLPSPNISSVHAVDHREPLRATLTTDHYTLSMKRITSGAIKLLPLSALFYWWLTHAAPDYIFRAAWFHPSLVSLIVLINVAVIYLDRHAKALQSTTADIAALAGYVLAPYFMMRLAVAFGSPQFIPGGTYSQDLPTEPNGGYEKVIRRVDFSFRREKSVLSNVHRYSYVVGEPAKDWCNVMRLPGRAVISESGECSLWNPFHWVPTSCSPYGLSDSLTCFSCNGVNPSRDGRARIQRLVSLDSQGDQVVVYTAEGLPINDATQSAKIRIGEKRSSAPIVKKLPNLRKMVVNYDALLGVGKKTILLPFESRSIGTFLGQAAWQGDWPTIKYLLDAGVDINVQNDDGSTPLLNAAWYGQANVVHQLLERGANPNLQNIFRSTPLSMAVHNQQIAQDLLAHGANVNQPGRNGRNGARNGAVDDRLQYSRSGYRNLSSVINGTSRGRTDGSPARDRGG